MTRDFEDDSAVHTMERMQALLRLAFRRLGEGAGGEEPMELTTEAVGLAVDVDPTLFLSMAPQSMVSLLELSGLDSGLVRTVAEALEVQAEILESEGSLIEAGVRREQAGALLDSIDPAKAN